MKHKRDYKPLAEYACRQKRWEVLPVILREAMDTKIRCPRLKRADLRGINLRGAQLSGADLRAIELNGADLRDAYLYQTNFDGANLRGADLRGADLYRANLRYANIRNAKLDDVKMDWLSATLISERLRQAADGDPVLRIASAIANVDEILDWDEMNYLLSTNFSAHPVYELALNEMVKWVKPGDDLPYHAPHVLHDKAKEKE